MILQSWKILRFGPGGGGGAVELQLLVEWRRNPHPEISNKLTEYDFFRVKILNQTLDRDILQRRKWAVKLDEGVFQGEYKNNSKMDMKEIIPLKLTNFLQGFCLTSNWEKSLVLNSKGSPKVIIMKF